MSDRQQLEGAFARLSEMLSRLVTRAEQLSNSHCAYRDHADRCTAAFGCPNQGRETPPVCRTDAWKFHRA